jgi:hypothetical protein
MYNNSIKLEGEIGGPEFCMVGPDDFREPCLRAVIKTEIDKGGVHPVDIYGIEACNVVAYLVACEEMREHPKVLLSGYLFSVGIKTRVIGERLRFIASIEVRRRVEQILRYFSTGNFEDIRIDISQYTEDPVVEELFRSQ